MKCPNCGKLLPDDSDFCQFCGSKLVKRPFPEQDVNTEGLLDGDPGAPAKSANLKCPKCGLPLPADSEFCQYCGSELPRSATNEANRNQLPVSRSNTETTSSQPAQAVQKEQPSGVILSKNTEQFIQGSIPVLLEKTLISKDTSGKVYANCSFRPLTKKQIQAMQVDVACSDIWRERVDSVEGFQYLDLRTTRDISFGEEVRIPLPDPNTRVIDVVVKKIMFEDGTLLKQEGQPVKHATPVPLSESLGKELFEEYKTQTYSNARFVPVSYGPIWVCTCGALNLDEEGDCHVCGDSLASLTSRLDEKRLQESVNEKKRIQREKEERERMIREEAERIKREQEERERIAREEALRLQREREERERREREEQLRIQREREAAEAAERSRIAEEKAKADAEAARIRAEQRKKRNRKIAIFSSAAAVLVLIVYLVGWQIIPSARYKKAEAAIAAGNYELAYEQFSKNHGYKDSPVRAVEARYEQAEAALASKDYDAAYQYYSEIAEYGDSETKAKEALYQKATRLMEEESYADAQELFSQISGYKDSSSLTITCGRAIKYSNADALFAERKFEAAAKLFAEAEYLDSRARAQAAYYLYAKDLLEQGKLHDAYLVLKEKVNNRSTPYEDAADLAVQAEYQYASDCFEAGKYEAAYASFANTKGYEDSDSQYLEAGYQYGLQLFEQKSYEKAATVFESLDKYKDSVTQANESKYQQALALMGKKQYSQAEKLFEELGRYSDSAKQLLEIKYQRAVSLVKERKYTQAVPLFKELGNYSDSLEQWKSAMWMYVLAHKNNDDKTTYEYLTALKRYNYKDSKKYYEDLYTWRATAKFYTSYSSTTQINSVSRTEKQVCVKWTLSGGAPGEEIGVRFYNTLPGGVYYNYNSSSTTLRDGDTASFTMNDFGTWAKPGKITAKLYNRSTSALIATATLTIY